ncbi:unnamed protein product [Clonostachys solani]|uniref:Uncharacterized protein n=1 Tax=Clonostachys solani TaxID=160281 RepID=A0A9N9Z262_9HYPO|nr:unnamed protein product [Clonostachys solani]
MSNEIPKVITRQLPNAVIYDLSTPGSVRITLPPTSTWSSGLHWHESHTEFLRVIKGSIRARVGDTWKVVTATDGEQPEVRIDRFVWHEWQRAGPEGEVIVVERTDPADEEKSVFFWNLNGVILNPPSFLNKYAWTLSWVPRFVRDVFQGFWITLNLFVIFYHLDNFPAFSNANNLVPIIGKQVDQVASHAILYLATWIGWLLGVQPVRRVYTPSGAYDRWWDTKKTKNVKAE